MSRKNDTTTGGATGRLTNDTTGVLSVSPGVDTTGGGDAISAEQRALLTESSPSLTIHFLGDDFYQHARVWGARSSQHQEFPAAIAEPASTGEVAALLKWATAGGIPLSLTNGGHGGEGFSGKLVIRMDKLNSVAVAPEASPPTVTCGGGVRVQMVDDATAPYGLATTLGNCGMVGVTGAMLGGGTGFMARYQGLTIDQLVSATIVLADGSIVTANEKDNSDLFYALRGGGGNFGVVVEFTLKCFKVRRSETA